jgi:hypothetical protein
MSREVFTIELTELPGHSNDAGRRLAMALKFALRTCGLKCSDYKLGRMRDSDVAIDSDVSKCSDAMEVSELAENASPFDSVARRAVVDEDVEAI